MGQAGAKKIGFVGLGAMGKHMATNIIKAGFPLIVYDLREEPLLDMKRLGAKIAKTAAQVGRESSTVVLMVASYPQLKEAVFPPDGVLGGMKSGSTLIIMCTIGPIAVKEAAKVAMESHVATLDAPVSGGIEGAQQGALTIMLGGDIETIRDNQRILDAMGKKIYHVGEVGMGQAAKTVSQLLLAVNMAAVAESLVMAKKLGLNLELLQEIICDSGGESRAFRHFAPRMIAGDFRTKGALNITVKDSGIVVNVAMEEGIPLMLANVAHQLYRIGQLRGFGGEDCSAVIKVFEEFAGLKLTD